MKASLSDEKDVLKPLVIQKLNSLKLFLKLCGHGSRRPLVFSHIDINDQGLSKIRSWTGI